MFFQAILVLALFALASATWFDVFSSGSSSSSSTRLSSMDFDYVTTKTKPWSGITTSASGQHMYAVAHPGYIYSSHDYGETLDVCYMTTKYFVDVATNAYGSHVYAVTGVSGSSYVYASADFGTSWSVIKTEYTNVVNSQLTSVATSANGKNVVIGLAASVVGVSSDYGVTWNFTSSYSTTSVAMSYDGQYIFGASSGGVLITSNDFGQTFTKVFQSSLSFISISASYLGNYAYAVSKQSNYDDGFIFRTTHYGETGTWEVINYDAIGNYSSIASSADGTKAFVGKYGTGLYVVTNSSSDVICISSGPKTVSSVAVNDKDIIYGTDYGNYIFATVYGE